MSQSRHRSKLKKETSTLIEQKFETQQLALEEAIKASNAEVMAELQSMRAASGAPGAAGSELRFRHGRSRVSQEVLFGGTPVESMGAGRMRKFSVADAPLRGLMLASAYSCAMSSSTDSPVLGTAGALSGFPEDANIRRGSCLTAHV